MTPKETWEHLLRIYKTERTTNIQDIPNLKIPTDSDETTSEEDETPRQNITNKKLQQKRKWVNNKEKTKSRRKTQPTRNCGTHTMAGKYTPTL